MKIPLPAQFFLWIFGGLFVIVVVFSITWQSVCSEPSEYPKERGHQQDQGSEALRHLISESIWRSITKDKQTDTAGKAKNADKPAPNPRLLSTICDAKITDWGLAFFTYCLVIVGWFAIRSTKENTEVSERAYVFHGYSPLQFRNGRATFTLNMLNAGKMPGSVTEVGWTFLKGLDLPKTREEKRTWEFKSLEYDFVLRPNIRWDIRTFESLSGDNTFVSYIKYTDFFTKREHVTYMGMHIYPDRPETEERAARAGGDTWNYWD